MSQQSPLTTSIPSPTLSLNFADISKRASLNPAPGSGALPTTGSSGQPPTAHTLQDVASKMRALVDEFLAQQTESELVRRLQEQVRISLRVIQEALTRYGLDHLAISYNGGKDCLVLLILILASLPTEHSEHQTFTQNGTHDGSALPTTTDHNTSSPDSNYPTSLQAIYVISTNPFPQVQSFVATTALEYHLDLASFSNGMRAALADYLVERPKVRAVFVGTRRTDPHGAKLTHFDPTDHGWPACMRVHPIIDWHYIEIWTFIRALKLPFCELYDKGYTSLGGLNDTRPNPALAIDGSATEFKPAYMLTNDAEERLGRTLPPHDIPRSSENTVTETATPAPPAQ